MGLQRNNPRQREEPGPNMDLDTYEKQKRAEYAAFAKAVADIFVAAIDTHHGLRLQHVQHRAKDPDSLRRKLAKMVTPDTDSVETIIKDLAGCRLVFYTNDDVSRFLTSGIVSDNFEIDWDRTKIFYPRSEANGAEEQFISNNYVVKLKPERTALPEYGRFAEMWCEVQVKTTLNHAWSELAHDTIYKKPELKSGFGGRLMQAIEERMKKIMREYLLPAGYEFQKVLTDFERLSSGKELFDRGALNALVECADNNAWHERLQHFVTYVLPYYDDIAGVQSEIRRVIVTAVKQARVAPIRPIDTPFGHMPGRTTEDIVEIAGDVIDQLRYTDISATFDALCELYKGAQTVKERNRWVRSAEALAMHNLDVWRQVGPEVQSHLVERIRAMLPDAAILVRPVLIAILAKVLESEVSGTSRPSFNQITFHRGAVVVNERLQQARTGAIDILKSMLKTAVTDTERRTIKNALAVATQQHLAAGRTDEIALMVLRDSLEIVEFWTKIASTLSYELRQDLEQDLYWLYHHNASIEDAEPGNKLVIARKTLRDAILRFRDHLNSDAEFVIYKTLVGFESVFMPEWDNPDLGFEQKEAYREQLLDELVERVTEDNAATWLARLRRCAATESNDLATFPSFGKFLSKLAAAKPVIVFEYLDQLDDRLAAFLPAILDGLDNKSSHDAVESRLWRWLNEGLYVQQIARYMRFAKKLDSAFLDGIIQTAIKQNDSLAVLYLFEVAADRHEDIEGGLIDRLFIPAVTYLASQNDTRWVNVVSPSAVKKGFLKNLSADQTKIVLNSLVRLREIDFHADEILAAIAAKQPLAVVDFFGKRMQLTGDDRPPDYRPVPFNLHSLGEPLSKHPRELVSTAKDWFYEDDQLFTYRGGQLLKCVFPNWAPEFEQALLEQVRSSDPNSLRFVIRILRAYNGQSFLHDICKEIISVLDPNDPLLSEVGIVLDSTGVVRGEFGFVEAYKERKVLIEAWRADPRDRVRIFAERHVRQLERIIAAEQRRSEEEIELRRREFIGNANLEKGPDN
jgi:ppGpp synthetase/RelA/SpoT-type nucleotidyltranferase